MLPALKTQYRLALPLSLLPAAAFVLCTPLIVSLRNLDAAASAVAIENFFSLCGILLLTPLAQPEQDRRIRELAASKSLPALGILLLRFLAALAVLPLLCLGFCLAMRVGGSVFPFGRYFLATFATAFALGALGFATALASDNWVIGYIAPVCYYAINYGAGARLGKFYLFSLSAQSMAEKHVLLATGAALVLAAFLWRLAKEKLVGKY